MKMIKKAIQLLIVIIVLFIACDKEKDELAAKNLEITHGLVCGWCSGIDSVVINSTEYSYNYDYVCDDKKDISVTKNTPEQDWNKIVATYNKHDFAEINLNTCYTCADGCDYWIRVKDGDFQHNIRYGTQDSAKVAKIQDFIDVLSELRKANDPRASGQI